VPASPPPITYTGCKFDMAHLSDRTDLQEPKAIAYSNSIGAIGVC